MKFGKTVGERREGRFKVRISTMGAESENGRLIEVERREETLALPGSRSHGPCPPSRPPLWLMIRVAVRLARASLGRTCKISR